MWYGPPMWGFGPLFPVMMFIGMVVMIVVIFRLFGRGGGLCGFGRHGEMDDLRKEVRDLRSEIETLRRSR